jgi:hypothetical protein
VSEGGLEPVEPPLDKRVSDILSAKMDPGGPGCTPLFGIGALQERTKAGSDSDPGSLPWGFSSATSLWIRTAGAWIEKALRWRGPDNAKVRSSGHPAPPCFTRSGRSVTKSETQEPLEPCGGDDEGTGAECRDPDSR